MPFAAMPCALGAWAAAVAGSDLLRRRVPNTLLVLMLVPALLALAIGGRGLLGAGPVQSLVGLLVAGVPLLPGYALGHMGAGDVKFSACIGLVVGGPAAALEMLLVSALLLGVASAAILALRRTRWTSAPKRIPVAAAFAAAFGLQLAFGRLLNLGF